MCVDFPLCWLLVDVDGRDLLPYLKKIFMYFNHSVAGMAVVERRIMASIGRHFVRC